MVDIATALPRFAASRVGFADDRFQAFLAGYRAASKVPIGELDRLQAVLEYLSLRRAAVCLARSVETAEPRWASEARARIGIAERLADGTHPLARAGKGLDR